MATRQTLTPEKSAKLARALAGAFDALINLDRVRAEVHEPEPQRPRPICLAEHSQHAGPEPEPSAR